jgi:flagellar basal-body rod protein FlgB
LSRSQAGHLAPGHTGATLANDAVEHSTRLQYTAPEQGSLDGNSVDLNRERANFADNSLRYEATLRFINGKVRTMITAIRGE